MIAVGIGVLAALAVLVWPSRGAVERPSLPGLRYGRPTDDGSMSATAAGRGWIAPSRRTPAGRVHSRGDGDEEVAEFAELLALCLRSGLPPDDAIQIARRDGATAHPRVGVVADRLAGLDAGEAQDGLDARDAPDAGGCRADSGPGGRSPGQGRRLHDPGRRWFGAGWRRRGPSDVSLLTQAWALGLDCGAPLTEAVEASAGALRSASAAQRRAASARAGPRASMWLLTVLPLVGPIAALAIGADPVATFGQPIAVGSVVVGLVLTALGWWWSRRLRARAEAGTVIT